MTLRTLLSEKALKTTLILSVFIASVWIGANRHAKWNYFYVYHWDSEGYYMYLPAVFLNGGFENLYTKTEHDGQKVFKNYPGTNKLYTKYTCGVAILQSPFFLTANIIATLSGSEKNNGYSATFGFFVVIGVAFYLTIGIYYVYKTLRLYIGVRASILSILIIWLGTSLLQYSALNPGAVHNFTFTMAAIIVYYTHEYYEKFRLKHLLIIAAATGLITLMRPTDLLIIGYFFLFRINNFEELKNRVQYWLKRFATLLIFPLAIFIAYIPQFIYWKYISGNFILYSYEKEGFTLWKNPMLPEIWIHPQNGFFLYAPLMLLSIIGIFWTWNNPKFSSKANLLIFLINSYICASWWYWNFGASYGYRPFIEFFPLMVIPLSYAVQKVFDASKGVKIVSLSLIVFLIFLSVRLNMIYSWPWEGPHWGWDDVIEKHKEALFLHKLK